MGWSKDPGPPTCGEIPRFFVRNVSKGERKKLFLALFHFTRRLPVSYLCAKVKKRDCKDVVDMTTKLSKTISMKIKEHTAYFESFDKIIIYYDNGQVELTRILTSLFHALLPDVEFRKVKPSDYKLFQVADLICTMELLDEKATARSFSRSELEFFHSYREFKKNYKNILRKKL